jgi:hypothetical protein
LWGELMRIFGAHDQQAGQASGTEIQFETGL